MNKLTEKEILEKYPKIFKDKDLPMQETCMCWGLEVPDAWLPVIDRLCYAMQNYAWTNSNTPKGVHVVAEQVKSKFGQLRFYYRLETEEEGELTEAQIQALRDRESQIEGMILMAESIIKNLPEFCGQLNAIMEPEDNDS